MTDLEHTLRQRLRRVDGVIESDSMFGEEMAYWVNGKEVAHFHGDRAVELRLTRSVIRALKPALRDDPRVQLRTSSSDWIVLSFESAEDIDFIVGLAERSAEVHRPPLGVPASLPPTGAELARRRRFH
jgi:hypothetical protein